MKTMRTLAALMMGTLLATQAFAADTTAEVGKPAPDFSLQDQNGKTVSLGQFKGKTVVLEWFNNDCPFVQKHYSTGHMNKLAEKYKKDDVVWLAINSTHTKSAADNAKVAKLWNIDRPILDDASGDVGHLYDAKNTPLMIVINKAGTIVYRGAIDSKASTDTSDLDTATNYVSQALDETLAGKPVSTPETKAYGCSVKYAK